LVVVVNKASSSLNTGNSKLQWLTFFLPCSLLQKEGLLKHIMSVVYRTGLKAYTGIVSYPVRYTDLKTDTIGIENFL